MKAINEKICRENNNIHSSTTEITGADNSFFFSQTTEWKTIFFSVSICAAFAQQISDPALPTHVGVKTKNGTTLWVNNSLNRAKFLNEKDQLYICGYVIS